MIPIIKKIKDILKVIYLKKIVRKKFVFYIAKQSEDLDAIYRLRHEVYCVEKKFISPCLCPHEKEIDEYDKKAIQFAAKDKKTDKIIGTVRLIPKGNEELPSQKHFEIKTDFSPSEENRILEVSRLAIAVSYRKNSVGERFVMLGFIKSIFDYCRQYDYKYLIAAIDNHPLGILKRIGLPIKTLGEPKFYMGSESTPILIDVEQAFLSLKKNNPILWLFLKY